MRLTPLRAAALSFGISALIIVIYNAAWLLRPSPPNIEVDHDVNVHSLNFVPLRQPRIFVYPIPEELLLPSGLRCESFKNGYSMEVDYHELLLEDPMCACTIQPKPICFHPALFYLRAFMPASVRISTSGPASVWTGTAKSNPKITSRKS